MSIGASCRQSLGRVKTYRPVYVIDIDSGDSEQGAPEYQIRLNDFLNELRNSSDDLDIRSKSWKALQ